MRKTELHMRNPKYAGEKDKDTIYAGDDIEIQVIVRNMPLRNIEMENVQVKRLRNIKNTEKYTGETHNYTKYTGEKH